MHARNGQRPDCSVCSCLAPVSAAETYFLPIFFVRCDVTWWFRINVRSKADG